MSEIDLKGVGLPGVKYIYAGSIKRLQSKGKVIRLKAHPWSLKESEMERVSRELGVSTDKLEDVFLALHDAHDDAPVDKKEGKMTKGMAVTWEDTVKYDAKGNPVGLSASLVAKLVSGDCVKIDNVVFMVKNNIGAILTKDDLKTKILEGLSSIKAEDLYGMTTYQLVRDQLLPLIPAKKLGTSEGFLPMKNGVLDICHGGLVPTEDIYLRTTNIDFDPEARECPKIAAMLDNMFTQDQKELVLSIIGAAISGKRAPFILALSGAGRNGKSLFREILEALMMEMITTEKLENLNQTFVNEVFMGKKISWQTEVDSSRKFTTQVKDITGGTTIQVRKKFVDGSLQYPLQMVCIIDTNSPPHFDDSQAINDRVRFVNMPHKFVYELTGEPNEVLIDAELVNGWKKELPAFFNMLLPYAQHFIKEGRLKHDIKGTVEQLRERSNLLEGFIGEWCDTTNPNRTISLPTFQKYFKKYAVAKNVAIPDIGQLRYKLRQDFGFMVKGDTITGVVIRTDAKLATDSDNS